MRQTLYTSLKALGIIAVIALAAGAAPAISMDSNHGIECTGGVGGPAPPPPTPSNRPAPAPCAQVTVSVSGDKVEVKNNGNTPVHIKVNLKKGNSCGKIDATLPAHGSTTYSQTTICGGK
jgi:hypothetical protein